MTRGSENIRLGAVDVYAYSATTLRTHLERADRDRKREFEASVELISREGRREKGLDKNDLIKLEAEFRAAYRHYFAAGVDGTLLARAVELENAHKGLSRFLDEADAIRESAIDILRRAHDAESIEQRFEKALDAAPPALAAGITDADGRFQLTVPTHDHIIVAARASRKLLDTEEHYNWLVQLPPESSLSADIRLTNKNLLTRPFSVLDY